MEAAVRTQEVNPAKLGMLFRKQFELCKCKAGDTIAIVSDLGTRREYIQAAFAAADELGIDIYEMCVNAIPGWTKVGVPTIGKCKGTLEALLAADMVLIFHVPLFSKWLRQVQQKGVRVQMIIDAPDDLEQLQSPPGLKEAVLHAHALYEKTQVRARHQQSRHRPHLRVRRISGDEPVRHGRRARAASITGAWACCTRFRTKAAPTAPWCSSRATSSSCRIAATCRTRCGSKFAKATSRSIEGGLDAALMRDWLAEGKEHPDDRDPYAVSHLGWGLNPQCRWDAIALNGDAPERSRASARSFAGNFLFSTGPNTQGGGKRTTRGHYDVPMRGCTIALDGNVVLADGRLVDPKMIVPRVKR